jgi:hypothetical protein
MRFLQLEWHNHERARNAWDIERAEMKAKIAKQEGEVRSAKKLNDQLNKHIRMLEQALTNERKKKADAAGGDAYATADDKGKKSGASLTKRAYIHGPHLMAHPWYTDASTQPRTPSTTPSSTSSPSSLTDPRPTATVCERSRSFILPNALKRLHISLLPRLSLSHNNRVCRPSQTALAS